MIAAETRSRSQRDGYRARAARRRRVQRRRPLPKHCTIMVLYAKHIPISGNPCVAFLAHYGIAY